MRNYKTAQIQVYKHDSHKFNCTPIRITNSSLLKKEQ